MSFTRTNGLENRRREVASFAISGVELLALIPVFLLSLGSSKWDLELLAVLLLIAVASNLYTRVATSGKIDISTAALAFLIAAVFLGPAPAVVVGVVSELITDITERFMKSKLKMGNRTSSLAGLLSTLAAFSWAALAAAYTFQAISSNTASASDPMFFIGVLAAGIAFDLVNFAIVSTSISIEMNERWVKLVRYDYIPTIVTQLTALLLVAVTAVLYKTIGIVALAAFALIIPFLASLMRSTPTAYRFLKQREDVVVSEGLKRRRVLDGLEGRYSFYYQTVPLQLNARGIRDAADLAFNIGRALGWPAARSLRAYELALFESLQKSPSRKSLQTHGFLGEFKEGLLRTYLSERRPTSPLLSEVVDLALAFTAYTYDANDKAELGNGVDLFIEKIETETRTIDVVLGYRERNKVALDALSSALIDRHSDVSPIENNP